MASNSSFDTTVFWLGFGTTVVVVGMESDSMSLYLKYTRKRSFKVDFLKKKTERSFKIASAVQTHDF
jgi:hypothetical protein